MVQLMPGNDPGQRPHAYQVVAGAAATHPSGVVEASKQAHIYPVWAEFVCCSQLSGIFQGQFTRQQSRELILTKKSVLHLWPHVTPCPACSAQPLDPALRWQSTSDTPKNNDQAPISVVWSQSQISSIATASASAWS